MASLTQHVYIVLGSFLVLFYLLTVTSAINCFQCNSGIDPNCDSLQQNYTKSVYYKPCDIPEDEAHDKFLGRPPVTETNKTFFCRKIYQHIKDMKGTVRIIRKCGWEKSPNKDCYKFEDDDHKEIVCQCFTDGCNSAPSLIQRSSVFYFITSAVSVYFFRLF
ncbi:uncharacterized protein LOC142318147 [Lycorma delicatula]|uniref:uncharacterized protein LOC142318147 n=1 Tax=Lycorma delicatula TaxID=130591 RepID=UPI003F5152D8